MEGSICAYFFAVRDFTRNLREPQRQKRLQYLSRRCSEMRLLMMIPNIAYCSIFRVALIRDLKSQKKKLLRALSAACYLPSLELSAGTG